jgi:hypothetical protein
LCVHTLSILRLYIDQERVCRRIVPESADESLTGSANIKKERDDPLGIFTAQVRRQTRANCWRASLYFQSLSARSPLVSVEITSKCFPFNQHWRSLSPLEGGSGLRVELGRQFTSDMQPNCASVSSPSGSYFPGDPMPPIWAGGCRSVYMLLRDFSGKRATLLLDSECDRSMLCDGAGGCGYGDGV